jgi:SAM-dependent methyltransferase
MSQKTCCPDCGSKNLQLVGRIPSTDVFAGRKFSTPFFGGTLYHCQQCYLGFRWPRMSKDLLGQYYMQGSEDNWTMPPEWRPDWSIARSWIGAAYPSTARVLDVGCFSGDFLHLLGNNYQRYGIEIHPLAKKRLTTRGIKLLGTDIEGMNDARQTFDCITAFDIIEHMESPKSFLSLCLEALKPVGHILISTGNLDAPTFRFMGSQYWYCTISEHISFISPEWCRRLAEKMGFHVTRFTTFSHGKTSLSLRMKDPVKNTLYKFMPHFFAHFRKQRWCKKDAKGPQELKIHPPEWRSASDHFMVLISR